MIVSDKGLSLIKKYEGFKSKPYSDIVGVSTIGYGSTYYPNGVKVKLSDNPISQEEATQLLRNTIKSFEHSINNFVKTTLTQNQFDAICSLVYNIGAGNFASSTLLKKLNKNPNDPSIKQEFLKWNKAGGKVINGLTQRRTDEATLYFS